MRHIDSVCGFSFAGAFPAIWRHCITGRYFCRSVGDGIDRGAECDADSDAAQWDHKRVIVADTGICTGEGGRFPALLFHRWILCDVKGVMRVF